MRPMTNLCGWGMGDLALNAYKSTMFTASRWCEFTASRWCEDFAWGSSIMLLRSIAVAVMFTVFAISGVSARSMPPADEILVDRFLKFEIRGEMRDVRHALVEGEKGPERRRLKAPGAGTPFDVKRQAIYENDIIASIEFKNARQLLLHLKPTDRLEEGYVEVATRSADVMFFSGERVERFEIEPSGQVRLYVISAVDASEVKIRLLNSTAPDTAVRRTFSFVDAVGIQHEITQEWSDQATYDRGDPPMVSVDGEVFVSDQQPSAQ